MNKISPTNHQVLYGLAIVFVLVLIYFVLFDGSSENDLSSKPVELRQDINNSLPEDKVPSIGRENNEVKSATNKDSQLVYGNLKLLGVVLSNTSQTSQALIQSNSTIETYYIEDKIKHSDATLAAIFNDKVILLIGNQKHTLRLEGSNSSEPKKPDVSKDLVLSQRKPNDKQTEIAKRIGNRPSRIEHIVNINASSYEVSPGLNPKLFRSAKFKEGDVLQEINGLDLKVPEQYKEAEALIEKAHTLKFTVKRNGRQITLYLDIPSKGLTISG